MKIRQLLFIFLPAIILGGVAIFFRIEQYPRRPENLPEKTQSQIIPLSPDDMIIGDKKAAKSIIVFGDFLCPSCRTQMKILTKLTEEYPKLVKIIWKGLPITSYPQNAERVQEFAYCASIQNKFSVFENTLLSDEDFGLIAPTDEYLIKTADAAKLNLNELNKCLESGLARQNIEAIGLVADVFGIQTIPTFFVNDTQVEAPGSIAGWVTLLQLQKN